MTVDRGLSDFFAAYEARTNQALADPPDVDVEATVSAFAEAFIHADPNGVRCGRNDGELRSAIPQGFAFYRRIGTKSMRIIGLTATPLDDHHAMAKVQWRAEYRTDDGREERIDFEVIYFVQTTTGRPKIFAYITGDEQKAYREHGLL